MEGFTWLFSSQEIGCTHPECPLLRAAPSDLPSSLWSMREAQHRELESGSAGFVVY